MLMLSLFDMPRVTFIWYALSLFFLNEEKWNSSVSLSPSRYLSPIPFAFRSVENHRQSANGDDSATNNDKNNNNCNDVGFAF